MGRRNKKYIYIYCNIQSNGLVCNKKYLYFFLMIEDNFDIWNFLMHVLLSNESSNSIFDYSYEEVKVTYNISGVLNKYM